MVREDDSNIKEASDTGPPLRNREDQRSMQSGRKAGEGWCLPRQVPWRYASKFSGFRAGLALSESWLVSTLFRYRYTGIKLSKTVKTRKIVHEFENNIREVDTHILWLLYSFSREAIRETQLLQEVHVVHLQWEAKLPGDQNTYNFWPAFSLPRMTEPRNWMIIRS